MSRPKHEAPQTSSDIAPERMASLPWHGTSARLLQLVRERAAAAPQLVHDRFADDIHRVVYRVLGPDSEHEDVVNQAFVEVLRGMHQVRDESRLTAWVLSVAINTARREIRRRKLHFWDKATSPLPEASSHFDDHDARELVRRTYSILSRLRTEDRIAFSLRYIEGHKVQEVAELTAASLATVHRRLARAETEFSRLAGSDELLADRLRASGTPSASRGESGAPHTQEPE